ncbi:MAG: RNA polymerase factor sigma-54 [Hyphomicrobiales bacterium]
MAMMPKLELRQGQSLVMTPQLQQAIKLLQMSNLELAEYVEAELEKNPLLERREEKEQPEISRPQTSPATSMSGQSTRPAATAGDGFDIGANIAEGKTLYDHLNGQLNIAITDPASLMIGRHLLGMVNDDGYLRGELEQAAEQLGADLGMIESVLEQLQGFDPPGVFARDLQECLALQLKEKNRFDPVMAKLLAHLDLLAKRDYPQLMELCGADRDDLGQMLDDIQNCNPRPGGVFGSVVLQPVVPDVYVREAADGSWHVELNSETLPRVLVNNKYYATVAPKATCEDDKEYISGCLANANWLVKSLDQRAKTILKVAREIVRQQDSFLAYGVQHLRPLKLRTVADAIDMHESTVSRVTSNKYMATPRGIVELKYFFTSAIASAEGGEAHSAEAVRQRIKELIEGESADKILSDDKIVDILKGTGVEIARRTVAKYREVMGYGSSVQRRREKKAQL